jgi:acyl carrier protein
MKLPRLPQTPNGKLDSGALPPVKMARDEEISYVAPRPGAEEALADIWRDTLGVEHIGAGDNFFALGGHSLLVAQVRARIHQALGIELPLDTLFDDQTLAELARRIEESTDDAPEAPPMVPFRGSGAPPVSYAQELMWQAEQDAPGSPEHWIDVSIRIAGALDASVVAQGVRQAVARHALLRTVFRPSGSSVSQVAVDPECVETSVRDGAPDPPMDTAEQWRDLESRPPLRAEIFRVADDHHVLRLRVHRILGDGYSTRLLFSEIGGFVAQHLGFDDYVPLDGDLQYADYAAWERSWLTGQALSRRIDHFRRRFDGAALPPALPTDHPRVDGPVRHGRQVEFEFPREVTTAARALAVGEQASLYSVLLTAFASAVGSYAQQPTVALAAPVARRNDRQTQLMLGPFMNSVPLLIDLDAAADMPGLVREVKSTVLGALSNQDAPWHHVLSALTALHGTDARRIGQVGFLMDDPVPGEFAAGEFRLTRVRQERVIARRELTVSMTTRRGQISGMVTYDDALFEPESIDRIVADFIAALSSSSSIERI